MDALLDVFGPYYDTQEAIEAARLARREAHAQTVKKELTNIPPEKIDAVLEPLRQAYLAKEGRDTAAWKAIVALRSLGFDRSLVESLMIQYVDERLTLNHLRHKVADAFK